MEKIVRSIVVLAAVFASVLWVQSAVAQVESTTGSIQGDVTDATSNLMPGATVEVKNVDTNALRSGTTDPSGHFEFLSLPSGNYVVTVTKAGFATTIAQGITLTVGRAISLKIALTVSAVRQTVTVTAADPAIETTTASSTSTLAEIAIATTPVPGRKFEDLLTLTPGVSIVQGPDGDEININGQRGIFNNISLDGGDYNNGFFGEQVGGQRAAVDITLEAVKEFQVVASGANAEFGRSAGGVINVITKSGTNLLHGSLFEYQRLEALTADTSDGKPLTDFHREQYGGSLGGPIVKDKLFYFAAAEGIHENLTRSNLSVPIGTPCAISNPVFRSNITDAQIAASPDCQRQVLVNFYKSNYKQDEGQPVNHVVKNAAVIGRGDYSLNRRNLIYGSYNFDWSRNPNQTFDVPTYGNSANGIEGPGKINTVNTNWTSMISDTKVNEAHFTYARENRGRSAINPTGTPDTAMGFATTFRFGSPFFMGPNVDEIFWRTDAKDNFSLVHRHHTFKVGGEFLYSKNTQIFRGFFLGRYIFDSVTGFLHYASPASLGSGYGPNVLECNGTFASTCGPGVQGSSPLLLYLQNGPTKSTETPDQAGYSSISNKEPSLFAQDTWKVTSRFTVNYGLRWEAQVFPDPVIPPAQTAYGANLNNPAFPSTGKLPNQMKMFQPRVGFVWDPTGKASSVLRASWGIFNARQNMLTQVGPITTNGVQNQQITQFAGVNPTYPNTLPIAPLPPGQFPFGVGVTVFDRHYSNPRIYTTNVGFEQLLPGDYTGYLDFTWSKAVYLTRFVNPNIGSTVIPATNADTVSYSGPVPFSNLGALTNTISNAKSLYRGFTVGFRKRLTHNFLFDGNYTYSVDKDDDSNERDPFTFRYANYYNLKAEYSNSDRDERHKFNFYAVGDLPFGFKGNLRMQAHSAQPITDNTLGDGSGAPCSINNSRTRFVNGIDCGRNHLRKNNEYFTLDFGVARPFHLGDRFQLIPKAELFNTFNNANNVNPLTSPALFNFDGFLRQGVGDPRQAQLSLRLAF